MTKLFATSALVAATIIAAPATANTVLLDYEGKGVEVKDSSQNYDFFNLGPATNSPMIYNTVNIVIDGEQEVMPVGPFTPDGRNDMRIETSEGNDDRPGYGYVELLRQNNFPEIQVVNVQAAMGPMDEYLTMMPQNSIPSVFQRARFATIAYDDEVGPFNELGPRYATFGANGNSGNIVDDAFDYETSFANLYGGKGEDLLEEVGDSVILGFKIDVVLDQQFDLWAEDGFNQQMMYCEVIPSGLDNGRDVCGPQEQVLASFFGFVEFTRGSVTPGILGVNAQGGAAVVPTPNAVPLPASVLLLGAGLGGLGAMRRRNKKA